MNLKYEETTIDGLKLGCTQFAATKAFTLFGRLVKVVGPAFAAMSAAGGEADVMSVLPNALRDVKPEEATALALEVLSNTTATMPEGLVSLNSQAAIDAVFSGRLPTMFRALAFAVKVNYSDFFGEGAAGAPAAAAGATAIA